MTTEKEISNWSRALLAIMEEGNEKKQKEAFGRLVLILKKKKKEYLFSQILKRVKNAYLKKHTVELFLAREHDSELEKKIESSLPELAKGKENIETKIDRDLIGGFRLKTSNFLLKASIKDFLNELKNSKLAI
jgi:F0F1-type ATP synthase delta subunit